ncbi:hypothetical protein QTP88_018892 [Uroleucon formosanum]
MFCKYKLYIHVLFAANFRSLSARSIIIIFLSNISKNRMSPYSFFERQCMTYSICVLKNIITSTLNNDDDDDDEMNVFIRFDRQVRCKIKDFTELTVLNMTDKDFKINFRLTRESVEILIFNLGLLLSNLKFECSIETQILVFIWYMTNLLIKFNLSDSPTHGVIINCLQQMNILNRVFIQWPSSRKAIETVEKFNALWQTSFPNVIGAVDILLSYCHIVILAPWEKKSMMPKLDRNMFYNRKQVPSVLLQVFISDGAYPLTEKIMVPYKDNGHLTQNQKNFNKILRSSRVVIEQPLEN